MKCCPNTRVNQIVKKDLNGSFSRLLDDKGIVNKNVFKIVTLLVIMYLFAGFKTIILCSVLPK